MEIKITVSNIYVTYKKDDKTEIVELYGPIYTTFFTDTSKEILSTPYTKKNLIDNLIIKKYSKVYKSIINIFYEQYNIKYL